MDILSFLIYPKRGVESAGRIVYNTSGLHGRPGKLPPLERKGQGKVMRMLLIRHAEPDYTVDGLTEKGRIEADLLSRRIARYNIRDFYVSPLGRARETADYTLRRMNRQAEVLPWLQEFRGRYPDPVTGREHLSWDLPPRVWMAEPLFLSPDRWADAPLYSGGNVREIWQETYHGVDALLSRYGYRKDGPVWRCENNTGDTIALFCHFCISMAVAGYLMNLSPMILMQGTLTAPSSVTELVTEERVKGEVYFRMTRLGDISHLEAAGEPRSMAGLFPTRYTGVDSTDFKINGCETLYP